MWQVAEGLRAAHHGGLTYVGIRPSGISLADDGSAVIQDFSIVRLIGEEQDEDVSYASPEELKAGSSPDALCDVFSFGAIYYELLTGAHPFAERHPVAIAERGARVSRGVGAAGRSRARTEPGPALPEHG